MKKKDGQVENDNQVQKHLYEGHSYMSRRELLGAGVIPFAGYLVMPTLWNVLFSSGVAQAATCAAPAAGGSTMPGYIHIHLGGGAGMCGNYIPLDTGGNPLADMTKLGLGNNVNTYTKVSAFKNNAQFPAPNGSSDSPALGSFFSALNTQAGATILGKAVFVAIPNQSGDDSSNDTFSALGYVAKLIGGTKLPTLGVRNTAVGNDSKAANSVNPPAPLVVSNFSVIKGALGTAGTLATMTKNQQIAIFNMSNQLSGSQAAKLQTFAGGQNMADLVQCATGQNITLIQNGAGGIDPGADASVNTIWGITTASSTGSTAYIQAGIVYNVLKGNGTAGAMSLGGYDYHDNSGGGGTARSGDATDARAGKLVGQILQTANALNTKVFIDITTDGSVVSGNGGSAAGGPWTSDRGSASVRYIIAFDPAGNVNTVAGSGINTYQIGRFTSGQVADSTYFSSGSADNSGVTAFANYLQFATGSQSKLSTIVGTTAMPATAVKIA